MAGVGHPAQGYLTRDYTDNWRAATSSSSRVVLTSQRGATSRERPFRGRKSRSGCEAEGPRRVESGGSARGPPAGLRPLSRPGCSRPITRHFRSASYVVICARSSASSRRRCCRTIRTRTSQPRRITKSRCNSLCPCTSCRRSRFGVRWSPAGDPGCAQRGRRVGNSGQPQSLNRRQVPWGPEGPFTCIKTDRIV